MARTNANLQTCQITQQLDIDYWGVEQDEKDLLVDIFKNNDILSLCAFVKNKLESSGIWVISEIYGIIHDSDTRTVWDSVQNDYVIEAKPNHCHILIKFEKDKNAGATLSSVANAIGIESSFVEKPKAGRYSYDNQLAYLVHAKDFDKYQYKPEDVANIGGDSYISIYKNNIERWKLGGIKKQNRQSKEDVDSLEYKILNGEITEGQILLTDDLFKIYSQNKKRIEDALAIYGKRKMYIGAQKLASGEWSTKVYYIFGKAGSGKTTFANNLIKALIEEAKVKNGESWTVCKTGATNPVDDYNGEEILLMDDVRGSAMRADDWLKLLDPYNSSPSSARYRNKTVVARTIIITASVHPIEFFYFTKGVGSTNTEAIDQFLRRLMGLIQVINADEYIHLKAINSGNAVRSHVGDSYSPVVSMNYAISSDLIPYTPDEILNKMVDEIINDSSINLDNYVPVELNNSDSRPVKKDTP